MTDPIPPAERVVPQDPDPRRPRGARVDDILSAEELSRLKDDLDPRGQQVADDTRPQNPYADLSEARQAYRWEGNLKALLDAVDAVLDPDAPQVGNRVRLDLDVQDEDPVEGTVIEVEYVRQVTVSWEVQEGRTYHVTYPIPHGHTVEDLTVLVDGEEDR